MRKIASSLVLSAVIALAVPSSAFADDTEEFIQAVNTFKAGNYPDAARAFYEMASGPKSPTQQQAEFYLAECLLQMKLLESAFYFYGQIVKAGPNHPKYADSLVGLVKVDEQLRDDALIPSILNREYDRANEAMGGKDFPPDALLKINYLVGRVTYEKGKLNDAISFLDTVTPDSTYYARALYLKGVVLGRMNNRQDNLKALAAFEKELELKNDKVKYIDFDDIHDLSLLGAARVAYGNGDYAKSVQYYESVPRFSTYWDSALFENGWARFQNEDLGGALGSLQALHAPQFEGSFQPESWILTATTYFFSCLYDETKFALKSYEDIYLPMAQQIKPILEGDHDLEFYAHLLDDNNADKLPKPVRNYLLANNRLQGFLNFLHQLDNEKGQIEAVQAWRSSPMSAELEQAVDQQRQVLVQVTGQFIKKRLAEDVVAPINGFEGQVAIIRFETTKKEKEILEANVNIGDRLNQQKILRPAMPGEAWDYWAFQGEFWIDEIGYYQYTLKSGCVKPANE
jgi:tetratricopeptide (TPR) repeat protein